MIYSFNKKDLKKCINDILKTVLSKDAVKKLTAVKLVENKIVIKGKFPSFFSFMFGKFLMLLLKYIWSYYFNHNMSLIVLKLSWLIFCYYPAKISTVWPTNNCHETRVFPKAWISFFIAPETGKVEEKFDEKISKLSKVITFIYYIAEMYF